MLLLFHRVVSEQQLSQMKSASIFANVMSLFWYWKDWTYPFVKRLQFLWSLWFSSLYKSFLHVQQYIQLGNKCLDNTFILRSPTFLVREGHLFGAAQEKVFTIVKVIKVVFRYGVTKCYLLEGNIKKKTDTETKTEKVFNCSKSQNSNTYHLEGPATWFVNTFE